ncbi:hypothetical protein [Bradyrhizobium sp. STM 3809]|uniref:hypothetical protein n=1 Tax=Bradyrhizobium sp. STM 3809 TaxID=551936 RepID=UPI0002409866|nr:hypothetical protein [Bradyrhizobium sp. STM 3809]CCE01670.1 exported hypothetical protein [Bradyrhizobium sp. STM 3809]
MRRIHRLSLASALAATLAFTASLARADDIDIAAIQQLPEVKAAIAACYADQARLCATVRPGQGRIVRCLAAQSDQLSRSCAAAMETASDALTAAGLALRPAPSRTKL